MEQIVYRLELDSQKAGIQMTLQGFVCGETMSRELRISLVSGSTAISVDPTDVAVMYVTQEGASEPSINECTIVDGTIVYNVLSSDISVEGMTLMQLKVMHTNAITQELEGAYVSPRFRLEVVEGSTDDSAALATTKYTALEAALVKANAVYYSRVLSITLTEDKVMKVTYADGTSYENDEFKTLYEYLLESVGRSETTEETTKGYMETAAQYVSDTEAIKNATILIKDATNTIKAETLEIRNDTEGIYHESQSAIAEVKGYTDICEGYLEQVQKGTIYTVFNVNLTTGELEYDSVNFKFEMDYNTGELLWFAIAEQTETEVENETETEGE